MRAEATRELEASRADVWGFLQEPYHLSDWWPGITSVRPDRRGFAPGARWEVVGPSQPTLFRKAYASGRLFVREVEPYLRASWYLTAERLTVEVVLEVVDENHTRIRLTVDGPWRPEALGRPRALPRQALERLNALCQTAASL
ncbi:MAG TPA: hypothetical protein VLJ76_03095 [Gaiellaceae bacterium]|nr:hypothetical protein [Gaiellaceae bacterium]